MLGVINIITVLYFVNRDNCKESLKLMKLMKLELEEAKQSQGTLYVTCVSHDMILCFA